MQEESGAMHPRPQLTRPHWQDLSGSWGFAYDDTGHGLSQRWSERAEVYTRTIQVPFPPESPASGVGDTGFHSIVWYRRVFQVPEEAHEKQLLLHCGAVDYRAHVWVNGQLVAMHEGGHTPFSADITSALHAEGEQVVVIRAEDIPSDLAQPRGKQDWVEKPHGIWYHRTTGIWQPVWLEPVASTHITQIRWTPDLDRGLLGLAVTLQRHDERVLHLHLQLRLHDVLLLEDSYLVQGSELQRQLVPDLSRFMSIEHVLWSPEHPHLLDATLSIRANDEVIDEIQSYVGLRSVGVGNGYVLLNGRPYYLRFALEQGYWPQSHLAAPSSEALRREVELAKELGFNGVRLHQKVEDPRFLYWCDRLGLLVWGEMANAYAFTPTAMKRLTREWIEVLERDYNHPCLIAWVPINESWGVPNLARNQAQRHYVQGLYHLAKALDPTRLVIGNDGWEYIVGDLYSIHDYAFDGATLRERYGSFEAVERTVREIQPYYHSLVLSSQHRNNEPVVLTEFGGISYQPTTGEAWFGYGTVVDQDTFLAKYRELLDAILESPALVGFCYTQLTDTGQETNGLLSAEREPKLDPAVVRTITQRLSAAIPGDVIVQMHNTEKHTGLSHPHMTATSKRE